MNRPLGLLRMGRGHKWLRVTVQRNGHACVCREILHNNLRQLESGRLTLLDQCLPLLMEQVDELLLLVNHPVLLNNLSLLFL